MTPVHPAVMSSDRMDWGTPDSLFDPLNAEFGFTLDAAASAANAKCPEFFDAQADGLSRNWREAAQEGCTWVNPPYGRSIGDWVGKALAEYHQGARVVMLVPSRTDTRWWQLAVQASEIRFLRGRVRFVGADGHAPFPSALLVFHADYHRPCYQWMDTP